MLDRGGVERLLANPNTVASPALLQAGRLELPPLAGQERQRQAWLQPLLEHHQRLALHDPVAADRWLELLGPFRHPEVAARLRQALLRHLGRAGHQPLVAALTPGADTLAAEAVAARATVGRATLASATLASATVASATVGNTTIGNGGAALDPPPAALQTSSGSKTSVTNAGAALGPDAPAIQTPTAVNATDAHAAVAHAAVANAAVAHAATALDPGPPALQATTSANAASANAADADATVANATVANATVANAATTNATVTNAAAALDPAPPALQPPTADAALNAWAAVEALAPLLGLQRQPQDGALLLELTLAPGPLEQRRTALEGLALG
ncbi:MAG: hypothetical protein ACKOAP_09310, partial [Vulcanococcus sp.]